MSACFLDHYVKIRLPFNLFQPTCLSLRYIYSAFNFKDKSCNIAEGNENDRRFFHNKQKKWSELYYKKLKEVIR
ncbi:hypothetical protein JHK84_041217 [Glycine max]|nr:hypothetical protein JHK84_041217 [Glycine max]